MCLKVTLHRAVLASDEKQDVSAHQCHQSEAATSSFQCPSLRGPGTVQGVTMATDGHP